MTALPALATLADLAAIIGVPVDDLDQDRATLMLELASDLVRDEVTQRLDYVADDTIDLPGSGTAVLLLPELPVTEVTLVTLVGENGTDDVDLIAQPAAGAGYRAELGPDGRQGILRRGGCWLRRAPVRVVYSHGYALESMPGGIRYAVANAAARGMVSPTGVKQETVGRYSATYTEAGLFLTDHDRTLLARFYPGTSAGSR